MGLPCLAAEVAWVGHSLGMFGLQMTLIPLLRANLYCLQALPIEVRANESLQLSVVIRQRARHAHNKRCEGRPLVKINASEKDEK